MVTMNGYRKIILQCTAALALFHIGATCFVRTSNLALLAKGHALLDAGLFCVPTPSLEPALDSWEAALCGALFFTLTSGVMALFSALAAPALHTLAGLTRQKSLALHAALFTLMVWLIGFSPETRSLTLGTAGLFLVLIPCGHPRDRIPLRGVLFHTLVPLLLALGIAGTHLVLPQGLFSGFRDAFLFDNPGGDAVRKFYYTYTLFPAEGFKRLNQKSQVTVLVQGTPDTPTRDALARLGHLPVPRGVQDYTLEIQGLKRILHRGTASQTVAALDFSAHPKETFNDFSAMADPFAPLRSITWTALFTAFPLFFYLLLHTAITLPASLFIPLRHAGGLATTGGAMAAIALIVLLASGLALPPESRAALAELAGTKTDASGATEIITRASRHPRALVRYRAAMAAPRIPDFNAKQRVLNRLAQDEDTNVACQALGAMGETRYRRFLKGIKGIVATRPEWYVQWYGYRAMGRLGWRQKR